VSAGVFAFSGVHDTDTIASKLAPTGGAAHSCGSELARDEFGESAQLRSRSAQSGEQGEVDAEFGDLVGGAEGVAGDAAEAGLAPGEDEAGADGAADPGDGAAAPNSAMVSTAVAPSAVSRPSDEMPPAKGLPVPPSLRA
jgi:hypothetical protein